MAATPVKRIRQTIKEDFKDFIENHIHIDTLIKELPGGIGAPDQFEIPLKEDVGRISIAEEYSVAGQKEPEGYVYKFISKSHEVLTCGQGKNNSSEVEYFCFHYDLDPKNHDGQPHLTILPHISLRYPTHKINLKDFLTFVKDNFFIEKPDGSYIKNDSPLWASRRT